MNEEQIYNILPSKLTIVSSKVLVDLSTANTQASNGSVHPVFNVSPVTPSLDSINSTNSSDWSYISDATSLL